jgi:hypothetical protein
MKNIGHQHILNKYFLYSENQLSKDEKKQIEEHLNSCNPCLVSWQQLNQLDIKIELPGPRRVPQTVWQTINTVLNSRTEQSNKFTFSQSLYRIGLAVATFIFIILAFGTGFFLTDFSQTSSTDNLTNSQSQQQYFESTQIERFSDFPTQSIVRAVKNMGILEGLEGK